MGFVKGEIALLQMLYSLRHERLQDIPFGNNCSLNREHRSTVDWVKDRYRTKRVVVTIWDCFKIKKFFF
jgi:hypothetical protein